MTTIATDGRTVAADGLACFGHEVTWRNRQKIITSGGCIFAICGVSGMQVPLVAWVLDGADPDKTPKCTDETGWSILVWGPMQDDRRYFSNGCCYPTAFPKVWAYGSGGDFAMGALKMGATAEQAIRVAIEMNIHTGGEIQVVNIADALLSMRKAAE